jgi:hypothetical protein
VKPGSVRTEVTVSVGAATPTTGIPGRLKSVTVSVSTSAIGEASAMLSERQKGTHPSIRLSQAPQGPQ